MAFIKTISYNEATGIVKKLYDQVKGPNNTIDNILKVHSLRPHTLSGHMSLYKNVLHHKNNSLPKWFLECIGIYVSILNKCEYCIDHHYQGMRRLLKNEEKSTTIKKKLITNSFENIFNRDYYLVLRYVEKLTLQPQFITETQISELKNAGINDGELLEVNQVASYFNYANRTVLGLGVNTKGDILGLSPNDSDHETNWNHS
ncbi:MAG: alkylhydroperoxidase [Flavobacteriaceae bacterium]|nr:alkylhydroperoxidase [Flavobacteriaceae bacterium]